MKKFLPLFLLLCALTAAHAQNDSRWTIGVKSGVMFGNYKMTDEFLNQYIVSIGGVPPLGQPPTSEKSGANFAVAAYGGYTILKGLSVQVEFNFFINQNAIVKWEIPILSNRNGNSSYSSLDIPILLRYSFRDRPSFGVEAGPYLSIPLGKMKYSLVDGSQSTDPTLEEPVSINLNFGMAIGIFAGFPLGPGRITGNIRYIFDFLPVKGNIFYDFNTLYPQFMNTDLFYRRGILMMLGYEYTF